MDTGLLWYDGDPKSTLRDKVERAAQYYRSKLGVRPNTCFVNSEMMSEKSMEHAGVKIVSVGDVLPGHFWLGVARSNAGKGLATPARSGGGGDRGSGEKD